MADNLPKWHLLLALAALAAIAVTDYFAGTEVRLTSFYLIPILLVTWHLGSLWGYVFTLLTLLLMLAIDQMTGGFIGRQFYFYVETMGRFIAFFVIVALASSLRAAHAREKELARTDTLTGLMNRRAFYLGMETELARRAREWRPFAILYTDCDNFKQVNDKLGHREGDRLLRLIATTMRSNVRKGDFVARLGGDEFAVFLPGGDTRSHASIAAALRTELLDAVQPRYPDVSFSIGLVTCTHLPPSVEDLIGRADQIMYKVKAQGKNGLLHEVV